MVTFFWCRRLSGISWCRLYRAVQASRGMWPDQHAPGRGVWNPRDLCCRASHVLVGSPQWACRRERGCIGHGFCMRALAVLSPASSSSSWHVHASFAESPHMRGERSLALSVAERHCSTLEVRASVMGMQSGGKVWWNRALGGRTFGRRGALSGCFGCFSPGFHLLWCM